MSQQIITLLSINFVGVAVLLFTVGCYQFIYPKKKINFLILIFLISLLPTISFWRKGVFESGDFGFHTQALISFYQSLSSGILIPRWSSLFCQGFGYPHFRYFYKLPYYAGSLFHFLGLSFISSTKLVFVSSYCGAGLSSYLWLKKRFSKLAAFTGAIFYLFAPYHLINLHFHHVIGENMVFALLPILLLSVDRLFEEKKRKQLIWFLLVVFVFCLIILTHHIASLLSFVIILGYGLAQFKKKSFLMLIIGLLASCLLTAFHWLPVALESNLVHQSQMHQVAFHSSIDFLTTPWYWGFLFQGSDGKTASNIGYFHILILIVAGIVIFKKEKQVVKESHLLVYFFGLTIVCLLAMQPIWKPVWESLPILSNFHFATRLFFVVTISLAFVSAYIIEYFLREFSNRKDLYQRVVYLICALTIGSTFLNWGNRGMIEDIDDRVTRLQIPGRCDLVALPLSVTEDTIEEFAKKKTGQIQVLQGQAVIEEIEKGRWTPHHHVYMIDVASSSATNSSPLSIIQENTLNFPGWELYDHHKKVTIASHKIDQTKPIITFSLPPGNHFIELKYNQTAAEKIGFEISVISLVIFGLTWFSFYQGTKT